MSISPKENSQNANEWYKYAKALEVEKEAWKSLAEAHEKNVKFGGAAYDQMRDSKNLLKQLGEIK